jgi:hypothetical protein
MANKKKRTEDKKGKGILLNLIPAKRKQLYDLAKKENKTLTAILSEALDNYMKMKKSSTSDDIGLGDIFDEGNVDLIGETKIW